MTSTAPLLPPGTGSLPPVGPPPSVRPPSVSGETADRSSEAREDERPLPGRAAPGAEDSGQGRATNGASVNATGEAPPLQPGRPLIGGGPFTLAVAFGLQADQTLEPATAATADSPAEAAEVEAQAAAEAEQGTGPNQLSEEEQQVVRELQQRDREVRQHEAAHAAAGGQYAGAPSYTYQRGPDGRQYAVGGEVSIDVSPVDGDPEATLQKARQIQAAALAPAEPSAQDKSVAAAAGALERQAQAELAAERQAEVSGANERGSAADSEEPVDNETVDPTPEINGAAATEPGEALAGTIADAADRTAPARGAAVDGGQDGVPFPSVAPAEDGNDSTGFRRSAGDLAGQFIPRVSTGFDGRTPTPQIVSISV